MRGLRRHGAVDRLDPHAACTLSISRGYRDLGFLERTAAARAAGSRRCVERAQPKNSVLAELGPAARRAALTGPRRRPDLVLRRQRCRAALAGARRNTGGIHRRREEPSSLARASMRPSSGGVWRKSRRPRSLRRWRGWAGVVHGASCREVSRGPVARDSRRRSRCSDARVLSASRRPTAPRSGGMAPGARSRRGAVDPDSDRQQAHHAPRPAPLGGQ